jgi:hypothetical protein
LDGENEGKNLIEVRDGPGLLFRKKIDTNGKNLQRASRSATSALFNPEWREPSSAITASGSGLAQCASPHAAA